MNRISHEAAASGIGIFYLGLMTNLLLLLCCAPLVVLLLTTDPASSWPLLLLAAPLCAPGLVGAFSAFRAHGAGSGAVARDFLRGWRRGWGRPLRFAAVMTAMLVVIAGDIRVLAPLRWGVAAVPALGVLACLVVSVGLTGLIAIAEAPSTGIVRVITTSAILTVRHGWLAAATQLVLGFQAVVFTQAPAIAIGGTAAPTLYLAWTNCRYALRAVLPAAARAVQA